MGRGKEGKGRGKGVEMMEGLEKGKVYWKLNEGGNKWQKESCGNGRR